MNRRRFVKSMICLGAGACALPLGAPFAAAKGRRKVLVLGVDGMDVHLTRMYMNQGLLPNFARIAATSGVAPVQTSNPPQSPVAWSNVIVGGSPALHGIFDFIHRDPTTMQPYLSTSSVESPDRVLHMGRWNIPLSGGGTKQLRQGKPFWDYLAEADIPASIFKMPANFPCEPAEDIDMVSGMGTPDLRGGYGNYTLFTTTPERFPDETTGGRIVPVSFDGSRLRMELAGPANTMIEGSPETSVPIEIVRDSTNPVVLARIGGEEIMLRQGEWSPWLRVSFPMISSPVGDLMGVSGIVKLYLKEAQPGFTLYVTPINIDPADPVLPVASPGGYAEKLVENAGLFYTQGFPEDTKALSEGALDESEYLELARQILVERSGLLDYEFSRFQARDEGLLFFYFSSLDQNSHMYWRAVDKGHPLYDPEFGARYGDTLKALYAEVDAQLGKVLDQFDLNDPNNVVMIMSDHGFGSFRRQVNLNTWLFKKGYLAVSNPRDLDGGEHFSKVNWQRTGVYNLGINCLYLNQKGREKNGVVEAGQRKSLLSNLERDLKAMVDPATGNNAVTYVATVSDEVQARHPNAPDIIVGWGHGYRTSWDSILGGFQPEIFTDNDDKWSGDHCIDPRAVPALFMSNRTVDKPDAKLADIAPTILAAFGLTPDDETEGSSLFTG